MTKFSESPRIVGVPRPFLMLVGSTAFICEQTLWFLVIFIFFEFVYVCKFLILKLILLHYRFFIQQTDNMWISDRNCFEIRKP